ncbi:MAG: hypothetical protein CMJ83_20625 [Planctomycetes bacterium]|nr:hypothetical protein [Planctomycetota bacterium]
MHGCQAGIRVVSPPVLARLGLLALLACPSVAQDPPKPKAARPSPPPGTVVAVYLTWQRDPTTTMTVIWHTIGPVDDPAVTSATTTGDSWTRTAARSRPLPHSDRVVHVAEITQLQPDTLYRLRLPDFERERRFQTLPTHATRPVRIVTGGDTMHQKPFFQLTLKECAKHNPDLIAFGGDLAYANGDKASVNRWYDWFDVWTRCAIGRDGRSIPVLCAIGNHEVAGGSGQKPDKATFFHTLFPYPTERGYGVMDLGEDISLFLLNTHHTAPIVGDQVAWLDHELGRRAQRDHLFAIYHVPGFPSHRSFTGLASIGVRSFWSPVFERHGLDVAFENHDHTYKRTPRIKSGRIDPTGVLYIGDGCFGTVFRTVASPVDHWYLERTMSTMHFLLTTIEGDRRTHRAIDALGKEFDRFPPAKEHSTEALHLVLRDEAEKFLAASKVPGLQVALIANGKPIIVRGFGFADPASKRRVTPNTTFQAASISKPVAALAAMRLVEQKKLELDRPVNERLRDWAVVGHRDGLEPKDVTLRRILSHTAGLSVHGYPGLPPGVEPPSTIESLNGIQGSNSKVVVQFEPGKRHVYSGGGYTIAQLLVEQQTKRPFADAMKKLVLDPLRMKRSSYGPDQNTTKLLAVGHDRKGRPLPTYRFAARAAAGLNTNAWDLARFLCVFMQGTGGQPPGRGVVKPVTIEAMLADQTQGIAGSPWGLGLALDAVAPKELGGRLYGHGGSNRGWKCTALAHASRRVGVVILTNGDDARRMKPMAMRLLSALARR